MPFTTNDSRINLKGRPKGSTNNTDVKLAIENVISTVFTPESIAADIAALKPKDRLQVFIGLLKYVTPSMGTMQVNLNNEVSFAELFAELPDE